jgi:NAD(P)-dependent dehydrogenase (short-subunit alcohol dehydrogenase family)
MLHAVEEEVHMTVALITGTSSGIGQATALHLARRGYETFASMRNTAKAGPLEAARAAEGLPLTVIELDVDDQASVEGAVARVAQSAGRIDVLVNNAALGPLGPLEFATDEIVRSAFETNVFGALRTVRAVLPGMRERRGGTIVNVSSVAGRMALFMNGVYASTKYALEAMSEVLAQELLEYNIRVVVVEPGFFETPMPNAARTKIANDPASPYYRLEKLMRATYDGGLAGASDPSLAAEVIERAITSEEFCLRYPAGPDAEVNLALRSGVSDEDLIRLARPMTEEAFFEELGALFPVEAPAG